MPPTDAVSDAPLVLLVEDDPSLSRLYGAYLANAGLRAGLAGSLAEARAAIAAEVPAAMLLDLNLPDGHGHELLAEIQSAQRDIATIIVTSAGSINMAVESMRFGAFDFLVKPFTIDRLRVTLQNALEIRRLKRDNARLKIQPSQGFEDFIGASPPMQALYQTIRDVAPSRASVFITGSSGTGKELAAQAVHRRSTRASGPLVALNCSAIPRDLVESVLFGHARGAFTGAISAQEGIVAQADGGTLFLDEIAEMELALQAKLLRFIETGSFQPVGSDHVRKSDVRFVCATNRDPPEEIRRGRFREDLYYRLNVVPLAMPDLRQRGSDILLIARHFLQIFGAEEGKRFENFDPEAERLLLNYDWPGNVRQLLNTVRNVVVLNPGGIVGARALPPLIRQAARIDDLPGATACDDAGGGPGKVRPLWQVERDAIEHAIKLSDGNIGRAAALLEIDASTIYRRRREWSAAGR